MWAQFRWHNSWLGNSCELSPLMLVPVPERLAEKFESSTGTRSPTKNEAGCPSCARSSMRRPCCTSESICEKFAAAPGMVARNVLSPPPNATTGGINEFSVQLSRIEQRSDLAGRSIPKAKKAARTPA